MLEKIVYFFFFWIFPLFTPLGDLLAAAGDLELLDLALLLASIFFVNLAAFFSCFLDLFFLGASSSEISASSFLKMVKTR